MFKKHGFKQMFENTRKIAQELVQVETMPVLIYKTYMRFPSIAPGC
jgi:hypothetical protein